MTRFSLLSIWSCVLLGSFLPVASAQEKESAGSGSFPPLIDVATLKSMIDDANLVVLDLGPEKEAYDTSHIPGAIYLDWVDDITDLSQPERYKVLDRSAMEKLMRRLGVKSSSHIVVYDDMDSRVSMRMYWMLKYYGIERVQLLDGGRSAWQRAGFPMDDQLPEITPSNFQISKEKSALAVNLDFVADRMQDPSVTLIDGRPVGQYSGKEPGKVFHTGAIHEKRGHIPGAVNIFWKDNFREDGTFKSKEELEKLYEGVTGSDMIVTYCNEGLHAVPPWFVLSELLGHGNVRVYDDSMGEWGNSSQPVEKDKDPS